MRPSSAAMQQFVEAVAARLGAANIIHTANELSGYSETSLPGPNVMPGAVVYPGSTDEVQALVEIATRFGVPLYPISMGQNIGMGGRTAVEPDISFAVHLRASFPDRTCISTAAPIQP